MRAKLSARRLREQNEQLEAEARAIFASLDCNSDGMLDMSEIVTALSESGMVDSEAEQFFLSLDTDNNNLLSMDEFVAGFQQYRQRARPPEQRAMLLSELVAFRDGPVRKAPSSLFTMAISRGTVALVACGLLRSLGIG